MSDLSQDELTILMIAAEGESMMPIGRWEKPLDSLVAKGLMHRHDKFNVVITPDGRKACKETEDGNIRGLIEANNTMVTGKETARRNAEAIAVFTLVTTLAVVCFRRYLRAGPRSACRM